jgi:hypothetical protein
MAEDYNLAYSWQQIEEAVGKMLATGDYVIEYGSTAGWRWEKWASGKAVCWGMFDTGKLALEQSGSVYLSTVQSQAFPPGLFASVPICFPNIQAQGGIISVKAAGTTDKDTLKYQVVKSWNGIDGGYFVAKCYGSWK